MDVLNLQARPELRTYFATSHRSGSATANAVAIGHRGTETACALVETRHEAKANAAQELADEVVIRLKAGLEDDDATSRSILKRLFTSLSPRLVGVVRERQTTVYVTAALLYKAGEVWVASTHPTGAWQMRRGAATRLLRDTGRNDEGTPEVLTASAVLQPGDHLVLAAGAFRKADEALMVETLSRRAKDPAKALLLGICGDRELSGSVLVAVQSRSAQ